MGTPRALIRHGEMGEAVAMGQMHQDLASRRGKRNSIVDQIFGDAFDQLFAAEYEDPRNKIR